MIDDADIRVEGDSSPQILFVYIDLVTPDAVHCLDYHLGIGYLRASLTNNAVRNAQLLSSHPISFAALVEALVAVPAPIIGFTAYDTNYYVIKQAARLVKERDPRRIIVIGGPAATFSDRLILGDTAYIDICVRGHAEESAVALVRALERSDNLSSVAGITFRDGGLLIATASTPPPDSTDRTSLDRFPSPYLGGVIPGDAGLRIGLVSSRGCRYHCTFCNFAAMSNHSLSYHSVERFLSELELLNRYHREGQLIHIHDDAFTSNRSRLKAICRGMIDGGLNRMSFTCNGRIDHLDEEAFILMREAHIRPHFGLESANPRVLRSAKKIGSGHFADRAYRTEHSFLARLREKVALAKSCGVTGLSTSIILGMPDEDETAGKESVEFIGSLGISEYAHNHLSIYSGTELFHTHMAHGIVVRQGPYGLPYEIEYAYDVSRVRPLANASQVRIAQRERDGLSSLLTGYFDGATTGSAQYALFDADTCEIGNAQRFLHDVLYLGTEVCVARSEWGNDQRSSFHHTLVEQNLVLPRIRFVEVSGSPEADDIQQISLSAGLIEPVNSTWLKAPLHRFLHEAISTSWRGGLFLSIADRADLASLDALLSATSMRIPTVNFSNGPVRIIDRCRWQPTPCALGDGRRYLCRGGQVRSCVDGVELGSLEDEVAILSERARSLGERCTAERGCAGCLNTAACAKCVCPPTGDAGSYCSLVKRHADASYVFDLLQDLGELITFDAYSSDEATELYSEVQILRGTQPGVFFAHWGALGFVRYSATQRTLQKLGGTMQRVLELLAYGLAPDKLVSTLRLEFCANEREAALLLNHLRDEYAVPVESINGAHFE